MLSPDNVNINPSKRNTVKEASNFRKFTIKSKIDNSSYAPKRLKSLFDSKVMELAPLLQSSAKEQLESVRYFLELL